MRFLLLLPLALAAAAPVDRLLVLSGSCSPATAQQIAHAIDAGFAAVDAAVFGAGSFDFVQAAAKATHAIASIRTVFIGISSPRVVNARCAVYRRSAIVPANAR